MKAIKNILYVILVLPFFSYTVSGQQQDTYVKENCVYFRGKKILKGNDETKYGESIFLEKQNMIVYVKKLLSSNTDWGIDETLSGIYTYNLTTKETQQIVSYTCEEGYVGYLYDLLKRSDDSFYFEKHGYTSIWSGSVYKYEFLTNKIVRISGGALIDVIKEGEYKNCLVINKPNFVGVPCYPYPKIFFADYVIDDNGSIRGCLFYSFDNPYVPEDNVEQTEWEKKEKYDYNNLKFVVPPHCDFEEKLDLLYNSVIDVLNYIQQYSQNEALVESQIAQIKKECGEYFSKYDLTNEVFSSLSQQQKYKMSVVLFFHKIIELAKQ